MERIKNVFNQTIDLMEQDNRGVQLGCYSVALVGLTYAIRRVRPFSRFKRPSDVPNHFIQERRELTGLVKGIDPNGALLLVRHKPLLPLPALSSGHLPVKISGVDVSSLGITWLQTVVVGSEVKFVPLAKSQNYLQCEVLLPQKSNLKKNKQRIVNVGEALLRVGFGRVMDIDEPLLQNKKYYKSLQVAAYYARRRELGIMYYLNPIIASLNSILKHVIEMLLILFKQISQIPRMTTT